MIDTHARLYAAMERVAPETDVSTLAQAASDVELTQLGFDSMSLIALFVELEQEFSLSVEALSACLHKRCTLQALLALCAAAPPAVHQA